MNRQERARPSATDSDATSDADRRFAHNLFAGGSDDTAGAGDKQHQGASEYSEEQRRWARELFATLDDEDVPLLAGLKPGRTAGRTSPPQVETEDKGGWFDRAPIVDD